MAQPTDLELSIFRTLCWFSLFDFPLSSFDVWKWLLKPGRVYNFFEVDHALEQSDWLSNRLTGQNGMFLLKRSDPLPVLMSRHRRFLDATRKFRKLRRAAHFFQLLPGVQAVFAVNTMAWWHTNEQSDIDLFIITKPSHIWSSRFLLVLPFLLSGHRPHHAQTTPLKDPFCFSFFCTTEALAMETLKWSQDDHYFAYWIKSIVPIFDRAEVLSQIQMHNKWTDVALPNARMRNVHPIHKPISIAPLPIQGSFLEPLFRHVQRNKFPTVLRGLANLDSRVVITDDMLKFHENDRRAEFIQAYHDAYEKQV